MSKNANRAAIHKGVKRVLQRDSVREINSIFDVLLEDEDHADIVGDAERKLERPAHPAMPYHITSGHPAELWERQLQELLIQENGEKV